MYIENDYANICSQNQVTNLIIYDNSFFNYNKILHIIWEKIVRYIKI